MAAAQASVASGADINATNDWGVTPIDLAVDKGHFDIAHYLLSVRNARSQTIAQAQQAEPNPTAIQSVTVTQGAGVPQPAPAIAVEAAPLSPQAPPTPALKGPNPFDPSTMTAGSQLSSADQGTDPNPIQAAPPARLPQTVPKVAAPAPYKIQVAAAPTRTYPTGAPSVPARTPEPEQPEGTQSPADKIFGALAGAFKGETRKSNPAVQAAAMAKLPFGAPIKRQTVVLPPNHLKGTTLFVGKGSVLGRSQQATSPANPAPCVYTRQGSVALCVEPVEWPGETKGYFDIRSVLYKGTKAIVRYDGGTATRYHVLFPSDSFDDVVAFFQGRFGPPTRSGVLPIKSIGTLRKENPVATWISLNDAGNFVTTLEIRAVDDVRGGIPDLRYGVVMLMPAAGAPNLPRRSLLKLMTMGSGV